MQVLLALALVGFVPDGSQPVATLSGDVAGDIHMVGNDLTLDLDRDTLLRAPTDDQFELHLGGLEGLRLTLVGDDLRFFMPQAGDSDGVIFENGIENVKLSLTTNTAVWNSTSGVNGHTFSGTVTATGQLRHGAGTLFGPTGRTRYVDIADGVVEIEVNNQSTGVRLDVATTDDVLNVQGHDGDDIGEINAHIGQFSSLKMAVTAITNADSPYAVLAGDFTITCDASGGAVTVDLPTAASADERIIHLKKTDATGNNCTFDGNGAETIDGSTTQALPAQYEVLTIQSDGTEWWVL